MMGRYHLLGRDIGLLEVQIHHTAEVDSLTSGTSDTFDILRHSSTSGYQSFVAY